jgi:hypothetical protein
MAKLLYIPEERQNQPGTQVVTLDDLEKFRVKLMMDIKMMLEGHLGKAPKRWLKSYERLRRGSPGGCLLPFLLPSIRHRGTGGRVLLRPGQDV